MLTAGVDIGSLATKAVILDADESGVIAGACVPSGPRPAQAGRAALQQALDAAGLAADDLAATVATGYGRSTLPFSQASVTEISCAARGAHLLDPSVRTVLDIGGQDSKAVRLDEEGYPADFALNDRCAAGTGRFLEVMAEALGTTVQELGEMALAARAPATISRTCTVFAESEIVGLLARGVEPAPIAAGLCRAVAERSAHLAEQVGVRPKVMLVGGVGQNRAIAAGLEAVLETELLVPAQPQLVVALGAAVIAAERCHAGLVPGTAQGSRAL